MTPAAPRATRGKRAHDEGARGGLSDPVTTAEKARLYWQKWRWYERNALPWNRARIHLEFLRREAFVRMPVHGNLLECFEEGRLEIGSGTLLEPDVWITAPERGAGAHRRGLLPEPGRDGRRRIALVEIGDHCMLANGCFVTDANHRFDDPELPDHLAGLHVEGADADRRQLLAAARTSWSPTA